MSQPRPDDRPAVRLTAPPCVMAGVQCLIDVEVDNAPAGCKLEVVLGQTLDNGPFKAEIVREFTDAKKRRIDLEATKDALVFDATVGDWTAMFDTAALSSARANCVLASSTRPARRLRLRDKRLMIDDSAPMRASYRRRRR